VGVVSGDEDVAPKAAVPWDLDSLTERRLRTAYEEMERFAWQIRSWGIVVPVCWHAVDHQVHRLCSVMWWYERVTRPQPVVQTLDTPPKRIVTPEADPRSAAEWWASPWGLAGMVEVWRPCHEGMPQHSVTVWDPATGRARTEKVPTPTLEESIAAHAARNRARR
jgi:hypothetical protein